jgi:hypothetical protein
MARTEKSRSLWQRAAPAGLCLLWLALALPAPGVSNEDSNGCAGTQDDPCLRTGTCEIQGAAWGQTVTVDRADIFDTQGWPGLCDMVHVALVQGACEPPAGQTDVTAFLSETSFATIPEIVGPLTCAGEPEPPGVPAVGLLGSGLLATMLAGLAWVTARRSRA